LEESDELQDKWAILLANMVDSEQNIENHVFPYILSQISSNEFAILENVYDDKLQRQERLTNELNQFKIDLPKIVEKIEAGIEDFNTQIQKRKEEKKEQVWDRDLWKLERERDELKNELKSLDRKELSFQIRIREPQAIPEEELKEFEMSNLIRLGLIKYVQRPYANSQTLEIPYEHKEDYYGSTSYTNVDLEIEIESEEEYILTELGELFIKACKIKE